MRYYIKAAVEQTLQSGHQLKDMYTTYHLNSAADINADILDAIKSVFKEKPIVLTVEEELDATAYLTSTPANKAALEKSIQQDKNGEHILIKHAAI